MADGAHKPPTVRGMDPGPAAGGPMLRPWRDLPEKPAAQRTGIAVSVVVHVLFFAALIFGEPYIRKEPKKPTSVEVAMIKKKEPPPPPVVEPPPPEPEKPKPKLVEDMKEVKAPKAPEPMTTAPPPNETPPPQQETTTQKIVGLSMDSTAANGPGVAVPVGNTMMGRPDQNARPADVKPLAPPPPGAISGPGTEGNGTGIVNATTLSSKPKPLDTPLPEYTEAARDRGIEGAMIVLLVINEEGRVADVKIVKGLGYGLDERAVGFIRENWRFTAPELGDQKVRTRIRYTINWTLN
jgi:periplasmic protein TonB